MLPPWGVQKFFRRESLRPGSVRAILGLCLVGG
jgi:hypothetical protein